MNCSKKQKSRKKEDAMSEAQRRELIIQGLARKKECQAKALSIVEQLIEPDVDREYLRNAAFDINHQFYDDIVDERSCSTLCGYPLCSNKLDNVPTQQFKISTSANKVYDITERKKFCNNFCFKSSNFYKEQIPTSPLWMRECADKVSAKFADEFDDGKSKVSQGDEVKMSKTLENSPPSVSKVSTLVGEIVDSVETLQISPKHLDNVLKVSPTSCENAPPSVGNVSARVGEIADSVETLQISPTHVDKVAKVSPTSCENAPTVEKVDDKCADAKYESEADILENVKKCFREWYTADTARFLYGRQFVGEVVGTSEVDVDSAPTNDDNDKLDAFLWGKSEVVDKLVRDISVGELRDPAMPKADKIAQGALRRRVVLDNLDRVLPDILELFGLVKRDVGDDLRRLLCTLHFSADNIYFRLQGWTLVAIMFIKMIAIKDDVINEKLSAVENIKYLNMMLLSYNSSSTSVDVFIDGLKSHVLLR